MTIPECAAEFSVSVDQMRMLIDHNEVPKIKVGARGVRIDPDDLAELKRRLKALSQA